MHLPLLAYPPPPIQTPQEGSARRRWGPSSFAQQQFCPSTCFPVVSVPMCWQGVVLYCGRDRGVFLHQSTRVVLCLTPVHQQVAAVVFIVGLVL